MSNSSPANHISWVVRETYEVFLEVKIAFLYMEKVMPKIFTTHVAKLGYASVPWSPDLRKLLQLLEKIQGNASGMVPELREMTFGERGPRTPLPRG